MGGSLLILQVLLLSALPGCSWLRPVFQDIPDSQKNSGVALEFSMYSQEADLSEPWWQDFNSPGLNHLMARVVHENFSVLAARARMEQARFAAGIAGAAQLPTLGYSTGVSDRIKKDEGRSQNEEDNWSIGAAASYEVDLWGRVLANKNRALVEAEASKDDLQAALMSVTGDLASQWTALISNRQQQKLFQEELTLQKKLLGLIKGRFPVGLSTALDIYQQQQAIERIAETLVNLAAAESFLKRRMAFLVGLGGGSDEGIDDSLKKVDFPTISDLPKPGLPADLLAARPDVRAAGLRLNAAGWAIVAAKADRLPNMTLSASQTFSSAEVTTIFNNWLFDLGAQLAGPVFDGGRRVLEVKRTEAVVKERLANYRRVVFNSMLEVENALADETQYDAIIESLNRQLFLSKKTVREARNRYSNGSSDFLNVLKEELNNLQLQQKLITTREKRIIARIDLHRALGGAWLGKVEQVGLVE